MSPSVPPCRSLQSKSQLKPRYGAELIPNMSLRNPAFQEDVKRAPSPELKPTTHRHQGQSPRALGATGQLQLVPQETTGCEDKPPPCWSCTEDMPRSKRSGQPGLPAEARFTQHLRNTPFAMGTMHGAPDALQHSSQLQLLARKDQAPTTAKALG